MDGMTLNKLPLSLIHVMKMTASKHWGAFIFSPSLYAKGKWRSNHFPSRSSEEKDKQQKLLPSLLRRKDWKEEGDFADLAIYNTTIVIQLCCETSKAVLLHKSAAAVLQARQQQQVSEGLRNMLRYHPRQNLPRWSLPKKPTTTPNDDKSSFFFFFFFLASSPSLDLLTWLFC